MYFANFTSLFLLGMANCSNVYVIRKSSQDGVINCESV
uniref:Uncharacterized protein n=1 Tax=Heterorhabditis bacteriophora TaxID=37862 RepID=A0A1I7WIZ8_HETBA